MKIGKEDYAILKDGIKKTIKKLKEDYPKEYEYYRNKNFTMFIWDIFHLAFKARVLSSEYFNHIYKYCIDNHLETALKKCFKEIEY